MFGKDTQPLLWLLASAAIRHLRKLLSMKPFSAGFLLILTLGVCESSRASRLVAYKLSTLSQDVQYLQSTLRTVLLPAGYTLIPSSVNISDSLGPPSQSAARALLPLPSEVENERYALRVVQLSAYQIPTGKIFSGWTYLTIVRTDHSGRPQIDVNRQAVIGFNPILKTRFWQTLVASMSPTSFQLEVRAGDLNLALGSSVPPESLPSWSRPRPHSPRATAAQIVQFSNDQIERLATPRGHSLVSGSISITESVVIAASAGLSPVLRVVETPDYAIRYLSFQTENLEGKVFSGGREVVIVRPNAATVWSNSSRTHLTDVTNQPTADIFLALNVEQTSFPLDVRFNDLGIRETPIISPFELAAQCSRAFRAL